MSAVAAPAPSAPAPAEAEQLDAAMQKLSGNKAAWAAAPLGERIAVLKEIKARLLDQLLPWSRATAGIRCSSRSEQVASDVLLTVVTVGGQLDGYIRSLEHLRARGAFPRPPGTTRNGQAVLDVFPLGFGEARLSLLGIGGARVQLYLQPGKPETQGRFYREPHGGRLAVVLGAGNQHHLALSDALHMAFVEGCVVMLKYHPIMRPAAPFIDHVLEPLARRGFLASTTDPTLEATLRLLYSPLTDAVHMTGGTATHDAIVWGADPAEQARRRAANDPLLKVPITSELGSVTPWLVVPGAWSEKELTHQARALAEGVANNCSCNCLAPKVVLLAAGWPQADAFVAKVKAELAQLPLPAPYYPGIRQRYQAFREAYPAAQAIGGPPAEPGAACGEPLPFLVNELPAYPADPRSEYALRVEPFAPVVTFVRMGVDTSGGASLAEAFLSEAVRAANEDVWGSLSCSVLVHPSTEAAHPEAVQRALDGLRFGTVAVNAWSAVGFLPAASHWGAFGGDQTTADIGSGLGAIHNCFMFDHTQKAVVRTPMVSAAHPLPAKYLPLPLGAAKVLAGLTHSGVWGALKLVFSR